MDGMLRLTPLLIGSLATTVSLDRDASRLPLLALAPVRFGMQAEDVVGLKRSGLICGPAGKLLWRDLSADGRDLASRTTARLAGQGLDLAASSADRLDDAIPPSRLRIVATVNRVAMRGCVRWRKIKLDSATGAIRGNGRIGVTWRVFDVAANGLVAKTVSCQNFTVDGAATLHAAFVDAFVGSADVMVPAIVRHIGSDHASVSMMAPPALACDAGETPANAE